jgi:hypothetical protein
MHQQKKIQYTIGGETVRRAGEHPINVDDVQRLNARVG